MKRFRQITNHLDVYKRQQEHTSGGVTWLTPSPGAPTINMFDYNTPGNPGQGYLYTNNKVFGIQIGNKASARADDGSVSGISIGDYSNSRGLGVALGHYAQSNDCLLYTSICV